MIHQYLAVRPDTGPSEGTHGDKQSLILAASAPRAESIACSTKVLDHRAASRDQVELDQCWDLLRQRRRRAGRDPGSAGPPAERRQYKG
jgi:hypothetical protein